MIHIESDIFNSVAVPLREAVDGVFVSGEYVSTPSTFPAVTIVESSNVVNEAMRTNKIENAAVVMYEVNIFTNTVGYKKLEANSILAIVDGVFENLGFTRIMCNPVANLNEATIYRIIARYEAVVDKDFWIYQR